MFRPHLGLCLGPCGKENQLITVRDGYCQKCNHERKQAKKKASGKKLGGYKHIRQSTGEAQIFEQIAEEREWICFVTGEKLWELTASNFIHVLPKALNKYPKMKLYKDNIVLGTAGVHFKWDKSPRSELREDRRFDKLFALEAQLKEEYKSISTKPKT